MINKKIWNINLPVLKSAFVTNISPKQYDTASNLFKIALYKDMEKYDLTGLTVQAVFKKADGTISYLPCTITNAASGELEIDITSQVLAIAAEVECEIRITGTEGELLIAPKFYFKVYESLNIDGAVESQDEFPVLVELLNRVETVETELQNITPEQIAQVTTNEQTRQDNEAARQLAEAERAGFYAGFNAQLADIEQKQGLLSGLLTTAKTSIVNAINELFNSKANKTQEAWITPTLLNGWTGTLKYRKNQFGDLQLRGTLICPATFSYANPEILTLPLAYAYPYLASTRFIEPRIGSNDAREYGIFSFQFNLTPSDFSAIAVTPGISYYINITISY